MSDGNSYKNFSSKAPPTIFSSDKASDISLSKFWSTQESSSRNKIYNEWWRDCLDGKENVCWPGRIKYFALSSGRSEDTSKRLPVSREMIKSIQKTSFRQILTLSKYNVPNQLFTSGILMLGSSTHLNHRGTFFDGNLSGITASQLPYWFQQFYKPGNKNR